MKPLTALLTILIVSICVGIASTIIVGIINIWNNSK